MFYVAMRNVPVFFSTPDDVPNKIKNPINNSVRLSALWIGHSTVLLQMDDKVIITDPLLTETAGEFARRVVEPGIDPEDIPPCDIILISHSHFDHLNYGSLEILEDKSPGAALVFPDGVENFMPDFEFDEIKMKNDEGYATKFLGEEKVVKGVKISTVFARHWSGRYGLDGYVWGDHGYTGYILEYKGMTVYFAGDTGYDSVMFKQLGRRFKIDLALIPIGPCADCNQAGTRGHVFPPESIQILKDVRAVHMIPIHYGTLYFAQAEPMEPLRSLKSLIAGDSISSRIDILKIGRQKIYLTR